MDIEDFRRKQGVRYEVGHILYLSILAILSGAHSYRKIHQFIKRHFKRFKKRYKLKWKRCPSYTTIRNHIIGIDSSLLENIFRKHAKELSRDIIEQREKLHLSFDGKVVRGSFDNFNDQKAIQVLSIFCCTNNIILAHEEVGCKTNEIPIAQKVIPKLQFENAIYTCDALNCQENTIKAVLKTKNNIIVQVKKNQSNLLNECIKTGNGNMILGEHVSETEKGHGRVETRTATIYDAAVISHNNKWSGIKTIIKVYRDTYVLDTKTMSWIDRSETSYYIATNRMSPEDYNMIIREHWGIENKNHNVRDGAMKEDVSRIRTNPLNMVKLRSFALNIMRHNDVKNIEGELFDNVLDINRLYKYSGI